MLSEIIRASADKGRSAILAVALLLSLAPAAAQEKLNVGALRFVSNGGLFVAVERGYFKAAGVEIALKFFDAAQPIASRPSPAISISALPPSPPASITSPARAG